MSVFHPGVDVLGAAGGVGQGGVVGGGLEDISREWAGSGVVFRTIIVIE